LYRTLSSITGSGLGPGGVSSGYIGSYTSPQSVHTSGQSSYASDTVARQSVYNDLYGSRTQVGLVFYGASDSAFTVDIVCLINVCTIIIFITGLPQSGKLPVLILLRGRKSAFSPHRGISLHRFTWNLAWPRGMRVHLTMLNFTSVSMQGGYAAPKSKISTFVKELPRMGEPFDRFLQMLGPFMCPTTLH